MRKINLSEVKPIERFSPGGKYGAAVRSVSAGLGCNLDAPDSVDRHPFDLAHLSLPPGKAVCPFHSHAAQWEMYVVISGTGRVRSPEGLHPIVPGDTVMFPPGEAHQIHNDGSEDLKFWIIADNPPGDACHYPDSNKWMVPVPTRSILKGQPADYFDGEE